MTSVVVTGSRVIRNGDSSPSPVTVVSADDLMTAKPGATLAEALNTMPVFAGSRGASSNPTTAGSAAGGSGSANQLNLRNIGATRTLVLMDGKRVPPTLYNSAVDVDLIPQMFVQRVDIVTGGVSAVYGSDAMSGVVNYIIDRKFNGFKSDASYGKSTYGDAGKVRRQHRLRRHAGARPARRGRPRSTQGQWHRPPLRPRLAEPGGRDGGRHGGQSLCAAIEPAPEAVSVRRPDHQRRAERPGVQAERRAEPLRGRHRDRDHGDPAGRRWRLLGFRPAGES
jgi:hypothetical protein